MPRQKKTQRAKTKRRQTQKKKQDEYPSWLLGLWPFRSSSQSERRLLWLKTPVIPAPDIGITLKQKGGSKQPITLSVQWPLVTATKQLPSAPISRIQQKPHITWTSNHSYPTTILCWNPDTDILHLCMTNITANNATGGIAQIDWIPPDIKPADEENRLFFAAFAQKNGIPPWSSIENRASFPVRAFIEKNGLELLDWVGVRINPT